MLKKQQYWSVLFQLSRLAAFVVVGCIAYQFGITAILLILPIGVFGLVANRRLRRETGVSNDRAQQVSRHVEELSHFIAEQERIARELRKSEEKFRNAFDHASIGMALVSMSGSILKVNRAFADMLRSTDDALVDSDFKSLLPAEEVDPHKRELTKLFYGAVHSTQVEQRMLNSTGEIIWVVWNAALIPGEVDAAAHYIFQFQDITDKKRAEQRLAHDALHDGLTDLPNRMLFNDRLQVAFRRAQRSFDVNFAVLYIDVDRFKLVNDSFGHDAGDQLLLDIGDRLRAATRTRDTVARLGGDEFAILIEDISDAATVTKALETIQLELARPFEVDGSPMYPTVSIGVAPWNRDYERFEHLIRDADTALYSAKRSGRNRFEFFSPEMHASTVQFLQNETDLREAVYSNQFRAFYQPIVNIEAGVLAGFEALIRWDHPRRGLVSPAEFIPVAEDTGLIFPIGEWMLRESCCQLSDWRHKHKDATDLWVSVNVSAKQFKDVDLVALITDVLKKSGLPAELLKLELTETAMADNIDHVVQVMQKLKEIGVRLSIDDFGTGYSSLSSLHRLPLDSLKIDRAFVTEMNSGESDEIVRTILTLAQSLELEVIAEGLETIEQLDHLRLLGCQMGQGYYFSRPLDAAAAEKYVVGQEVRHKVPSRLEQFQAEPFVTNRTM